MIPKSISVVVCSTVHLHFTHKLSGGPTLADSHQRAAMAQCQNSTAVMHEVNQLVTLTFITECLQHSGLQSATTTICNTTILLLQHCYCYMIDTHRKQQ